MKKNLSTFATAMIMALTIIGCKPEEPETALPVLTPESEAAVTVPAEGGSFKIVYKLDNPVEGGNIVASCEPEADWISHLDYSAVGVVSFDVSSNEGETARSTEVVVLYDWPGGEPLSFSVIVEQEGKTGEDPEPGYDESIVIDVTEKGQRYFSASITPSNKEMSYLVFFKTADVYDSFPDTDSLLRSDMTYYEWMAYMYDMTEAQAVAEDVLIGDMPDYLCNAEPDTEYVLYAYGIDTLTLEVLTDVAVSRVRTQPLDQLDFTLNVSVSGHVVTAEVTPDGYDGYYLVDAYEVESIDAGMDFAVWCSNTWNTDRMHYETYYGMTPEQILQTYAKQGEETWVLDDLMPEKECRLAVFALDDMAWLCSEPVTYDFTTGSASGSSNVITINVTDVTSREASIEFLPSNDDPFAYIVTEAAQFEGMTEDEIIDYCANRLWASVRTGRYIDTYGKLTPGTEYYAIAYGNYNGEVTTGLFKESFTTTDTWVGTREFSLEYGPWYDLEQLAEVDPQWQYSVGYYDCLLPVDVPEELAGKEYYYALYTVDAIYGWDDETLYSQLYDHGTDYAPTYFLSDYGMEFVLVLYGRANLLRCHSKEPQTPMNTSTDKDSLWGKAGISRDFGSLSPYSLADRL